MFADPKLRTSLIEEVDRLIEAQTSSDLLAMRSRDVVNHIWFDIYVIYGYITYVIIYI